MLSIFKLLVLFQEASQDYQGMEASSSICTTSDFPLSEKIDAFIQEYHVCISFSFIYRGEGGNIDHFSVSGEIPNLKRKQCVNN